MIEARTIKQAKLGSRNAQTELLTALQDRWFRFCLSFLRDAELARDATQETALRFLRQISEFREESQISTWSLGIALNVAREMRRKREILSLDRDPREEASGGEASPADSAAMVESRNVLRTEIAKLPERQREAVTFRYLEDLSTSETAEAMQCSEGTVKATLHQALRALRGKLKQLT
jgi:RNA polymerase sigma-70 factor (ECF subfamily)